ncbi:MAG: adenylate/guanylate cyclase domain-containing protein [Spirochaetes bacterium]|nr:MAG: adenylate/guanylate cyclase domain-containing protein [Spirochaetota bacterium]
MRNHAVIKKSINLYLLIPIIAAALFTSFNFLGFYRAGEYRIYDQFLHIKPPIRENDSLLLLNVDDLAIAKVGMWPWSRSIMADGLILMKEFGAGYAVFDIEYTEESPMGVNSRFLEKELPEIFTREFSSIQENISALFEALAQGAIPLSEAQDFVEQLKGLTDESRRRLMETVNGIARDNDVYLGQAARFFENAFFTVNMLPDKDEDIPQELKDWTINNIPLTNVEVKGEVAESAVDIRPAILPVISNGRGAGFPNIVIDPDGVRRRVDLLIEHQGRYFPQLAFSPLLHWLNSPEVTVMEDKIVLNGARLPDGSVKDIAIPLDEGKRMIINWPKKEFDDSFRQLSYYYLVLHDQQEKALLHNLRLMNEAGYLRYYQGQSGLLDPYEYAESLKNEILEGGDTKGVEEYREVRAYFFEETGNFLKGDAENRILSDLDRLILSDQVPEEYKENYRRIKTDVKEIFSVSRELFDNLTQTRDILEKELKGSFCIIGWTGTATTDRGVNPFDETYDNVGTHASVANTILNQRFLDVLPWWYSAIFALFFTLLTFLIIRNLNPLPSILIGLGFIAALFGGSIAFFLATGIYFPILTPLLSVVVTFLAMTIIKFLSTAKEKTYIRNAFSHYLSADVISELLENPDKLTLGGEKKHITAVFTDVKGFSTISEALDPTDLVKLLNIYLTEMSDTILDIQGTIDKYEGDAIIAFFGAPIDFEDHARRACLAAIRMKKKEALLNQRIIEEKLSPSTLNTRIGINTGEMVVGNMGTARKMDYTIMGNAVNLAARLEGVNKQYGTWILLSESTRNAAGDGLITRRLDRVRVVGIHEPVRLFELVDEEGSLQDSMKEVIDIFHLGLTLFEEKKWDEAGGVFRKVLEIKPDDGPTNTFLKRCNDYQKNPPPQNWDGVFNLAVK